MSVYLTADAEFLIMMQIVMTAVVCCWAHLMMPADPRKTSPVLGVSLSHASGGTFPALNFCMSGFRQAVRAFEEIHCFNIGQEGQDTLPLHRS